MHACSSTLPFVFLPFFLTLSLFVPPSFDSLLPCLFLLPALPVSWIPHFLASSLSHCLTFLLPHCLVAWPCHQLSTYMYLNSSLFHSIRLIPSFPLTNSTLPYLPPSVSFPLHFFRIINFPLFLILPPFFPSL